MFFSLSEGSKYRKIPGDLLEIQFAPNILFLMTTPYYCCTSPSVLPAIPHLIHTLIYFPAKQCCSLDSQETVHTLRVGKWLLGDVVWGGVPMSVGPKLTAATPIVSHYKNKVKEKSQVWNVLWLAIGMGGGEVVDKFG